ncbi:hypothetical protein CDAR_220941 [Caerostris darwini]|uniref:Uncharacterized protein n=1 Tax=Caerostris darwini TaxID=1538125 RepID=A0AAV4MWP6_9ARAC|nr:hypothetical protein CDAR_220941 [Caerostris darwini]
MRFICPKHSVKPIVLLFHLIEYQIRKTSARVEARRLQFLLMLQLVGIPFQSYSAMLSTYDTAYDTPVCLETSRALHSPCAATADTCPNKYTIYIAVFQKCLQFCFAA